MAILDILIILSMAFLHPCPKEHGYIGYFNYFIHGLKTMAMLKDMTIISFIHALKDMAII